MPLQNKDITLRICRIALIQTKGFYFKKWMFGFEVRHNILIYTYILISPIEVCSITENIPYAVCNSTGFVFSGMF